RTYELVRRNCFHRSRSRKLQPLHRWRPLGAGWSEGRTLPLHVPKRAATVSSPPPPRFLRRSRRPEVRAAWRAPSRTRLFRVRQPVTFPKSALGRFRLGRRARSLQLDGFAGGALGSKRRGRGRASFEAGASAPAPLDDGTEIGAHGTDAEDKEAH